jgi:hypothetical protein
MTEHADFEALSAFVDGEAPEWGGHVDGCAPCRATVEQLRAVRSTVGTPVAPPDAAYRELAVTAALGDLDRRQIAERARFSRRRALPRNLAAVAAVVVACMVGLGALLAAMTSSTDEKTTLAGPGFAASAPAPDAASDAKAAVPPTDLGDVPDAATLVARARPSVAPSSSANSGAASAAQPRAAGGTPSNALSPTPAPGAREVAPTVVGTRPCEEQARSREPALRDVVYYAVARRGQVPAVVLGFSTGPSSSPVTLLLLAQDGCAELLRGVAP